MLPTCKQGKKEKERSASKGDRDRLQPESRSLNPLFHKKESLTPKQLHSLINTLIWFRPESPNICIPCLTRTRG